MSTELYKKYRPTSFKEMVGQKEAVSVLTKHLKNKNLPQCLLMTGGSGTGKTTACKILKSKLKCDDLDFHEINAASSRGIDTVRDIEARIKITPFGPCRIYLLDEAHQMTRRAGGDAQTALLKILEETPRGVYFFLATTDPEQLLKTIRTRCEEIKFKALTERELSELILSVVEREGKQISQGVVDKIVEASEGSARWALVHLGSVIDLDDEKLQLECLTSVDIKRKSFDLVKALLYEKASWASVAKVVQELDIPTDELETFRRFVLACANTEILKANKNSERANSVIEGFSSNWFESGKAGLSSACFYVVSRK